MTLREQLERAQPRLDGATYDRLRGKINDEQYTRSVRETVTRPVQISQMPDRRADRPK
jgi:hypothetical protein